MPVVCVLAPKGGAGASLVATNLALALARSETCLLLDLHPEGGDADLLLGLPGHGSWADLLPDLPGLRPDHIGRALARHPRGLDVLHAPAKGMDAVTPDAIPPLISFLGRIYPWLVLDCAAQPTRTAEAIFPQSSFVLLVTTPDPVALRRTSWMRQLLPSGLRGRAGVVVNQSEGEFALSAGQVSLALELPVLTVIPIDRRAAAGQMFRGEPVVTAADTGMGRAISGLADTLRKAGPAIHDRPVGRAGPAELPRRETWPAEGYR